ncbi:ubiquitin-like activating enzyme [Grosmannia clavigera kw1407]|uniref:NEDD8-activating enzyme E1 regulatory subunit n=1 Tax=Grosmannia clavigera (strain kw1407 / UAMH 11150) TaxID=655863 RepID=F0XI21_GROCL|nr:ubiquitin-like activating enzyme [Grosmannia clavigera kw1407]EFX03050.1 ubiquitin-like activating enzyme [Grosmannia clavigera kw1407]
MPEIVASQTPPILHGPSEKERKYDRQLRLWAASGQEALEAANILVVNSGCGTVATETLKNLILPGIGKFTIFDKATVQEEDLGVNFFLEEASLGKSRAQCCTELLLELNPEVQGDWYPKPEKDLTLIEEYGKQHKTPLLAVHSAGFYSYFRICLLEPFPVVDTHPDETATTDLRLLAPWSELEAFSQELAANIDTLDDHAHGHLPYIVILLHYLERWRKAHDGKNPVTYKEKVAFRQTVADGARKNIPEGAEENFEEAVSAVLRNVEKPTIPSSVREVFAHDLQDSELRSGFWAIARAVKQFYEKHGALPLPGKVPDMKAQSKVYIQLQTIYKNKARKDAAEVLATVRELPGGKNVDPAEVELFCKNAAFIKLINATETSADRLSKVTEEEFAKDENAEILMAPLSLAPIYLALYATAHAPEATSDEILKSIDQLVPKASQNERVVMVAEELARAKGGELHNISALTGGMVAQEIIKIITRQYIPIDNTCIFDGISSRCQILRL